VHEHGLSVEWILDTHPHADHFSAARYLSESTGAPAGIGEHVVRVQELWKRTHNWEGFPTDGSQWDRLFKDGERFRIGQLDAEAIFSPSHTPASITYVIGDAAFVHDTIFMPDSGTARADLPGGNASVLWKSIQRILRLPDETRLFTGHDYQPGGREARWESTAAEQKRSNPHLANKNEAEFVALRNARDETLPMPSRLVLKMRRQGRFWHQWPASLMDACLKTKPDALASAGANFLVATADPSDRAVVTLDRDGAASAISAIISVGTISGSIVVAVIAPLRAHCHTADRCINGNLS
jgi:glyoxylase-like metal-dependent hydrolase (beta-lactamase superfamily II)